MNKNTNTDKDTLNFAIINFCDLYKSLVSVLALKSNDKDLIKEIVNTLYLTADLFNSKLDEKKDYQCAIYSHRLISHCLHILNTEDISESDFEDNLKNIFASLHTLVFIFKMMKKEHKI